MSVGSAAGEVPDLTERLYRTWTSIPLASAAAAAAANQQCSVIYDISEKP
jgi:hypothetical protein